LPDLFLDNASASPDAVAVVDPPNRAGLASGEPRRLTYAELKTATDRLATALLEAGVGKDDIVMVQLPNVVELVVVYLAGARIGAIITPLPMQFRTHELRYAMGQTGPKVFVTAGSFGDHDHVGMVQGLRPEFPSVEAVIALGDDLPAGVRSLSAILDGDVDTSGVDAYAARTRCRPTTCTPSAGRRGRSPSPRACRAATTCGSPSHGRPSTRPRWRRATRC